MLTKNKGYLMNKQKQNNQILTEQNLKDIETALLRKIIRSKEEVTGFKICYIEGKYSTCATASWIIDKRLHVKSGIARKRKCDKYNKRTGRLLALIDMM